MDHRFKVPECKSDQIGESGETESMHSDSDADEAAYNDQPPTDPEEDRSECRNFFAMLQLAPRNHTATPTAGTSTLTSVSPVPSKTPARVVEPKPVESPVTKTVTAKVSQNYNEFLLRCLQYLPLSYRLRIAKSLALPFPRPIA